MFDDPPRLVLYIRWPKRFSACQQIFSLLQRTMEAQHNNSDVEASRQQYHTSLEVRGLFGRSNNNR